MSFRENRWGGLFAQGIGTSMLQMGNIVRNPRIWIPPTLASAVTGPIATCVVSDADERGGHRLRYGDLRPGGDRSASTPAGSAMWKAAPRRPSQPFDWLGLVLICFLLPAVLTVLFAMPLRKLGWIKENDLKLEL